MTTQSRALWVIALLGMVSPAFAADTIVVTVGDLPPGKSVTITFQATIADPLPVATNSVSNQGTVSGTNFTSVSTDDPDVGGASDATVTSVPNRAPTLTPAGPFALDEHSAAGTNVAALSGSDPDGLQTLTWSITGGDPGGVFSVDASGVLEVADAAALDYEAATSFSLDVTVTDDGSPNVSDTETVVVNLNDIVDPSSTVLTVSDPDVSVGDTVTFTATVASSGPTPTGTVTFKDGGKLLGTGTLDGSAVATLTLPMKVAGTRAITAIYGGDAGNQGSTGTLAGGEIVRGTPATAGQLRISEYRLRGAGGFADEFVEIANPSWAPHTVATDDGSAGYAVATSDGVERPNLLILNGAVIPGRDHFLFVNGDGYSLAAAATHDRRFWGDIPDGTGLALFNTADPGLRGLGTRIDAVGPSTVVDPLYREGAGHAPLALADVEQTVVRMGNGGTVDTEDNAVDFTILARDPAQTGSGVVLGAAGPQAKGSTARAPITVTLTRVDGLAGWRTSPNWVRNLDPFSYGGDLFGGGTYSMQRRITNGTGKIYQIVKLRVIQLTTDGGPVGAPPAAVVRVVDSTGTVTTTGGSTVTTVTGLTLDSPPAQLTGGGLNASLSVDLSSVGGTFDPGDTIDVQVLLAAVTAGRVEVALAVEVAE